MSSARALKPLHLRVAVACWFLFTVVQSAQVRDGTLSVKVVDDKGRPTPVRIRLQNSRGETPRATGALAISESAVPIPKQVVSVMWGRNDRAEGYSVQPDGSFYIDGEFSERLPPGTYTVTLSKGFEFVQQTDTIDLKPGNTTIRNYRLKRWVDMPARGWYSSDDHIHLRRSPADNAAIVRWIAAEDIHVGNILEMGDFWGTVFSQYAFGEKGRYQQDGRILSPGQEEPRTPEIGHTISLGASEFVRFPRDYYSYDRLFDRVRQLGGVTGFAHQGMSFHGYRGMALNVLRGKIDFLELAQFCVPGGPLLLDHYYLFLDLGFKLTALAGSDFPWCGQGPGYGFAEHHGARIGNARFYAYVGDTFSYDRWFAAVRGGRTFVTTGPMLLLTVNGHNPGDTVDVTPGTKLHVTAEAFGGGNQVPLHSLEVVSGSKVLARSAGQDSGRLSVDLELPARHGMWIAAKCQAGTGQAAHTTPVYVTVGGDGFHNRETARHNLDTAESFLREVEQELANPGTTLDSQAVRHRSQLERQVAEARAKLHSLVVR